MKLRIKDDTLVKMTCVDLDNDTDLIIPEGVKTIKSYFSTFLCACDYFNSMYIKTISIPSTVEKIEQGAFAGFGTVKTIKLSKDNKFFKIVNGCLYTADLKTIILAPKNIEEIEITEGTEIIDDNCFEGARNLKEVHLPSTLKTIGFNAFTICVSLSKIIFPDSLEKIGYHAFSGDRKLFEVSYNKKTTVDDKAFEFCAILTNIIER